MTSRLYLLIYLQEIFSIIERIESMRKQVLEVVVETIEDFTLEIIVGKGSTARNIKIKLPHFTIVGTTTMPSQVDERLNSFMSAFKFTPYNKKEIGNILSLSAVQKGITPLIYWPNNVTKTRVKPL